MSEIEQRLEKANEKGVIIGNKILLRYADGWHHLISMEMLDRIRNNDDKEYKEITGKYLFFSPDLVGLIDIGTQEILEHDFHVAKVKSRLLGNSTEYVLCLYYKDDSRKHELAERCKTNYPHVKYRYWKSDESTRRGEYPQEFLGKLDSERSSLQAQQLELTSSETDIECCAQLPVRCGVKGLRNNLGQSLAGACVF